MTTIRITPKAVKLFKQMQQEQDDTDASREAWWGIHRELHDELRLRPWQWPAIVDPSEPVDVRDRTWEPQARQLYRELEQAAAN